MRKIKFIDLFSGAGGLLEGFMQSGLYEPKASVEWEKAPIDTLRYRLETKWGIKDAYESAIWFDMQRTEELFSGFDDDKYGKSKGLDYYIGKKIDVVIGGPPCQAYSQAGRTKDEHGMKYDYRNYLFEYYLKTVERYQPELFVFENVPGMLSAMPDGTPIVELIKKDVEKIGYEIVDDIRDHALIDISDYGVPQNRKRVILVGLKKNGSSYEKCQEYLKYFYDFILPKYKFNRKITVEEAIGDLPKAYPLDKPTIVKGIGKQSYTIPDVDPSWGHVVRFQNDRDIKIFGILTEDIASGKNELQNADKLNEIYNNATGGNSKVHKYHVLRRDQPSTTITAHLHKDGLRFIHYDPEQKRTITVREAARLQSFPDDFKFLSTRGNQYKMIGNAVPPEFARRLSLAINDFFSYLIEKRKKEHKEEK